LENVSASFPQLLLAYISQSKLGAEQIFSDRRGHVEEKLIM